MLKTHRMRFILKFSSSWVVLRSANFSSLKISSPLPSASILTNLCLHMIMWYDFFHFQQCCFKLRRLKSNLTFYWYIKMNGDLCSHMKYLLLCRPHWPNLGHFSSSPQCTACFGCSYISCHVEWMSLSSQAR